MHGLWVVIYIGAELERNDEGWHSLYSTLDYVYTYMNAWVWIEVVHIWLKIDEL